MPPTLPEFFIRFLTEPNDVVLDPFGGSNTTGAAAESLGRRWVSIEPQRQYIAGSLGRFPGVKVRTTDLIKM
jgi:site-specific DNA-methyltransferase (cytosine-N4-specific)